MTIHSSRPLLSRKYVGRSPDRALHATVAAEASARIFSAHPSRGLPAMIYSHSQLASCALIPAREPTPADSLSPGQRGLLDRAVARIPAAEDNVLACMGSPVG
jgi:hypothetical protein